MLITVRGTFKQGQITLLEAIPDIEECDVLVTFLDSGHARTITDIDQLANKALIQDMREQVLITLGLTPRELEILQCAYEGLKNREIAVKLELGEGTVRNYLSSLHTKLDAHNRIELIQKAIKLGLLPTTEGSNLTTWQETTDTEEGQNV